MTDTRVPRGDAARCNAHDVTRHFGGAICRFASCFDADDDFSRNWRIGIDARRDFVRRRRAARNGNDSVTNPRNDSSDRCIVARRGDAAVTDRRIDDSADVSTFTAQDELTPAVHLVRDAVDVARDDHDVPRDTVIIRSRAAAPLRDAATTRAMTATTMSRAVIWRSSLLLVRRADVRAERVSN